MASSGFTPLIIVNILQAITECSPSRGSGKWETVSCTNHTVDNSTPGGRWIAVPLAAISTLALTPDSRRLGFQLLERWTSDCCLHFTQLSLDFYPWR
ncbi:hypothetical protein B0H65DRAFT_451185 [Neurospora tetraspora]|uniref:Secreted protein n=1 Tax=Neurospora tetraspora TaxID=94610 RepID=A0AAE0JPB3_9PEZI|nr:hypothetical protein B0H65DRAFT_451185 [Neurospora tetraspora]